jgi:thiol:disulfide interchange protein DsbD
MKISGTKFLSAAFQVCLLNFLFTYPLSAQSTSNAHAKIVRNNFMAAKDSSIQLGLLIHLAEGWHIYWKNSGDSGIPTSIEWAVQQNIELFQKQWPIPKAFEFDGLVSYGYEDEVLFIVELKIPPTTSETDINFSVKLESLICKDVCIPFDTLITYQINLSENYTAVTDIADLFSKTVKSTPIKIDHAGLKAKIKSEKVYLQIDKSLHGYLQDESIYFLSFENGLFLNSLKQQTNITDGFVELIIEQDQFRTKEPEELYGLLIPNFFGNHVKSPKAYEIKIPIKK